MWNQLRDLARWVWTISDRLRALSDDMERLSQNNERLNNVTTQLIFEMQRLRDELSRQAKDEQNEREKLALRLKIEMLKFEKKLPPGDDTSFIAEA